jgi:hemerythrin-like metal-binding protein
MNTGLLIDHEDPRYTLGVDDMDATHLQFMHLVNPLHLAQKPDFCSLFDELVKHTEKHFDSENTRMHATGFPASTEHQDEHLRVLGELHRIARQVHGGSTAIARAYVKDRLPEWFNLHASTMDSALAAHIRSTEMSLSPTL